MFNWNRFKRGEIAVHCNTDEKAKDFLEKCKSREITWGYGYKSTKTLWHLFKEKTIYTCKKSELKLGSRLGISKKIEIVKWER